MMPTDADPEGGKKGPAEGGHARGKKEAGKGRAGTDRSGADSVDRHLPVQGAVPPEEIQQDVWDLRRLAASRGLRFWDVEFEVVTRQKMVELGTYVLPYRFGHWTFGREYARMQKFHDLGLVEILETVINTRPARAYLLDANTRTDNRMVIAHVLAHVDFFANNMWFERTPRNILREAHHHELEVRRLQETHGATEVESVLDRALSIQWHVDFWRHYERMRRTDVDASPGTAREDDVAAEAADGPTGASGLPPGMTPSDIAVGGREGARPHPAPPLVPGTKGHRDLLGFLLAHAPLTDLEHDLLRIVREETLYFYPNAITKIMNEGWATYWHAELLREFLPFDAFDTFAVKHSHLMGSEGLNPYKLGALIYEDIRNRGDAEYGEGEGLKRMFEARRFGDDVSFLREHMTQEVVDKAGLYLYDEDPQTGEKTVTSTRVEDIRPGVLGQLENLGKPLIVVVSGDHEGEGGLLLMHRHDGRDLDLDFAADVLKQVQGFWKRPVYLETLMDDRPVIVSFDGEEIHRSRPESPPVPETDTRAEDGEVHPGSSLVKRDGGGLVPRDT